VDSTVVLPVSAFVEDTSFYVFVLRGDRYKDIGGLSSGGGVEIWGYCGGLRREYFEGWEQS
jgi:hypothetical protein